MILKALKSLAVRIKSAVSSVIFPKGLKRRWVASVLGYTFILVMLGLAAYTVVIMQYHYYAMQAALVAKARTATDFFSNYSARTYAEYYQNAYLYT